MLNWNRRIWLGHCQYYKPWSSEVINLNQPGPSISISTCPAHVISFKPLDFNVTMTTGQMVSSSMSLIQLGNLFVHECQRGSKSYLSPAPGQAPLDPQSGWCCFIASGMLGMSRHCPNTLCRPQVHDFGCSMSSKDVLFVIPLWLISRLSSLLGERLVWQTTKPGANKGLPS